MSAGSEFKPSMARIFSVSRMPMLRMLGMTKRVMAKEYVTAIKRQT